jgi:hypothetical protein
MASCSQSRLHCRCGSGSLYVCACVRVRGVCYGKHVNCKLRPVHSNQCIAGGRRKGRKDRKIKRRTSCCIEQRPSFQFTHMTCLLHLSQRARLHFFVPPRKSRTTRATRCSSDVVYSTCVIIIRAQTSPHHQMIRRYCRHPHHTARKCNRTRNTSKSAALWLRLSASSAQYPDRDPSTEGIRPRS